MTSQQHHHRCPYAGCEESWLCQSASCSNHDLCDACERRQFEDYAEQRGWTISQPELPELEVTKLLALTARKEQ